MKRNLNNNDISEMIKSEQPRWNKQPENNLFYDFVVGLGLVLGIFLIVMLIILFAPIVIPIVVFSAAFIVIGRKWRTT